MCNDDVVADGNDDTISKAQKKRKSSTAFDNIGDISTSEYLARVARQAKAMPDTFALAEDATTTTTTTRHDATRMTPIDGSAASLAHLLSPRASLVKGKGSFPKAFASRCREFYSVIATIKTLSRPQKYNTMMIASGLVSLTVTRYTEAMLEHMNRQWLWSRRRIFSGVGICLAILNVAVHYWWLA